MSIRKPAAGLVATIALVAVLPGSLRAAESPWAANHLTLELGAFLSDFDTDVELSGPTGGDQVNLEDDLGLDPDQTAFRAELRWRVAKRHRINLAYYAFSRDGEAAAQRNFVVETDRQRLEFNVDADVTTEFDWQLVPLTYTYSFLQSEKAEVAASIGVHWLDAKVEFAGTARVNGTAVLEAARARETTNAPLPVIGLEGAYALTPHWFIGARGQWFGLHYSDYSGDLTDFRLLTEYRFANTFGVGIGYTWYDIDFSYDDGETKLEIGYDYNGPEAFVTFSF